MTAEAAPYRSDAEILRELMGHYDRQRTAWIGIHGDDWGFDEAFTDAFHAMQENHP